MLCQKICKESVDMQVFLIYIYVCVRARVILRTLCLCVCDSTYFVFFQLYSYAYCGFTTYTVFVLDKFYSFVFDLL